MFKFNFTDVHDTRNDNPDKSSSYDGKEKTENFNHTCEEVTCDDIEVGKYVFKSISVENVHLFIRDFDNEENSDEFLSKYYQTCDVTPSVYEGGLKVWECTYDLLSYLLHSEINFKNKTVLDLGCGCGILGMYAAQQGARTVHFHDYNADVLTKFTAANVIKNNIKCDTKFISGDWGSFCNLPSIQNESYDFILTCETLYNTSHYSKLCKIFADKLSQNGEIIVASKSYYFGVGGSTKIFLQFLNQNEKYKWDIVWKNTEGVQREIISVKFL